MAEHESSEINRFLAGIAKGPSAIFVLFFLMSGGLHIWQSRKYRSWPYTWALPVACILMMAGFICREITADDHDPNDLASAVQGLFYSAAPVFALPLYTFLACSPLSSKLLPRLNQTISYVVLWIFTSAIISCTSQGCAGYFNPDAHESSIGSNLALLKASLILQLFCNGAVLFILVVFVAAVWKSTSQIAESRRSNQMLVLPVLALMALMIVRNVFRTVQAFASPLSAIWTDEAYFWVFEGCVMLCYSGLFHILHPGRYISSWYGGAQPETCG